ncbi:DNA-binding transcriptional regulator, GntR family [Paracoccus alkenifer]|uniref:DNA-binding transcriptional regulator, GntR family n=1 Tax=Paracoccus alkenifer TaxID=65735 RepID=A0A1H6KQU4_9RHOB|nr:DNA-binding transcriptional regulator, GntR family [Paracoccus alkenifer]
MLTQENSPKYETAQRGDTLAQQVSRQLSSAILSGMFAPLDRLNIRRLADEMGVSATPAREAILRLISDEVLQINNKGAIIVPERTAPEIAEIFSIRRMLEGQMAASAAAALTDDDIAFLEATQAEFLRSLADADFKEVLRYNSLFHFRIYERAGQPIGLRIVESLWLRIGPTLRHMYPYLQRNRGNHRGHENVIDAARHRDPEALRHAILADLDASETALKRYIANPNGA